MFKCKFCGKEFNKNGIGIHQFWCKDNPDKEKQEEARGKMSESKKGEKNSGVFKKGHIVTEEVRKKLSDSLKGRKLSEEHKKKMSERMKGNKYGLGMKHTEETKKKMSEAKKGKQPWNKNKHLSEETKLKMSKTRKGHKVSEKTREKISDAQKGSKSWKWKGGISKEKQLFSASREWKKAWRIVYKRDNGVCQCCGEHTIISPNFYDPLFPNMHHVIGFECVVLRLVLSNLILLCYKCHKSFIHTNKNINKKYILEPTEENIKKILQKKRTGTLLEFLYCYIN